MTTATLPDATLPDTTLPDATATFPPDVQADSGPLRLTDEQIAQYWREGYLIVRNLIPASIATEIIAAHQQYGFFGGGEGEQWRHQTTNWTCNAFLHDQPDAAPDVHRLLAHRLVTDVAEQLLEAKLAALYGMVAVVKPGGGKGLPWHNDNQYGHWLGHALNIFTALSPITHDMGHLWVSPKSHLQGMPDASRVDTIQVDGFPVRVTQDPPQMRLLPDFNPGDTVIFTRYTLHRSLINTTDRIRYAYAAQFRDVRSRNADTGLREDATMLTVDALRHRWQGLGRNLG